MTVIALVSQVKTVSAGETVGYGRTWQAPRDMRVATVAAGYGDGFQRAQSNAGQVLLRGVRCPVVGRVSMDLITVDISAVDGIAAGDEAVIVGGREGDGWLGADEVAAAASTISYEFLCGVSARVPRLVTG
jgi:alanine racemase